MLAVMNKTDTNNSSGSKDSSKDNARRAKPGAGASAYDVAIIGGGHNGLTCAAYLAAAGKRVVILEKNVVVGGAAISEEFHPGFTNSVASYTVSLLNPKVIADLELAAHGLQIIERPVANFWPIHGTRGLLMPYGLNARQRAIAQFSKRDAENLPAYDAALERAANVLRALVLQTPPNAAPGVSGWGQMIKAALTGRQVMRGSIEDQRVLLDLFTKSAADFLSQWFEHDVVKGAFAFDGIVGAYAGPHTPGTAYVLLHHCFGEVNGKSGVWGHAVGGMGAITQAMAKAATSRGVEIRTDCAVAKVLSEAGGADARNDKVSGVELASGEIITADVVAANVAPKLLFRDLVDERQIDPGLHKRFLTLKSGSGTFRMNVALKELPDFLCRPGTHSQDHHGAGIIIGPDLDYLERAFLDARREGWSRRPVIEMLIPSVIDKSLAPDGQHVASLFVQHVAPQLPQAQQDKEQDSARDGDYSERREGEQGSAPRHTARHWDNEKDKFADLVIDTVNEYAPNFKQAVLARQVLSPLDLERRFGLIDGDIFHGQLSLDQLFATRPVWGHAAYRMPLRGLYLCGSGGHPGGGVTGAPGHNAAREILKDMKRKGLRR